MALARNLLSRRLHSLLEPQSAFCVYHIIHSNTSRPHKIPPFHHRHRPIASLPQAQHLSERKQNKKPLHFLFQGPVEGKGYSENNKLKGKSKQGEAVGLSEKTGHKEGESISEVERLKHLEKKKLERKLKKFTRLKVKSKEGEEEEVDKGEKPKKAEPKRLSDLFSKEVKLKKSVILKTEKPTKPKQTRLCHKIAPVEMHKEVKQREPVVLKELSPEMENFVYYLYKEGYFNDANFAKGKSFDLSWFDLEFARHYILFAVQKFSKDKQEISKWLSGSDLKQVAMFGCPSVNRAHVIPSKRLRNFFKISENTVCSKCRLRDSCKFANQNVWRTDTNNLDLSVVMKVICSYAMLSVHPQLVVPEEIKNSVSRLLKEVLKLSQTI